MKGFYIPKKPLPNVYANELYGVLQKKMKQFGVELLNVKQSRYRDGWFVEMKREIDLNEWNKLKYALYDSVVELNEIMSDEN